MDIEIFKSEKEEFMKMINSNEFKNCKISLQWGAYLIAECESYSLPKEAELVRSLTAGDENLSKDFASPPAGS